MVDRDTVIEVMAEAVWLTGEANKSDALALATAAYDTALPFIRNAALEEAAAEAFRWDTGRQASEAIRALKDTP